jgi:cation transport protein ChaC
MRRSEPFPFLTDAARSQSLRTTLAQAPASGEYWVFGYGSLMWNPGFRYLQRHPGTIYGYERRLSIWSSRARGTPENPGLALGLEPGAGHCRGIVYRLDPQESNRALEALWEREMSSGIYEPHWLSVTTDAGEVQAIAFVVNRHHANYAGELPLHEMADIIAAAHGRYGPCREYLENTVRELAALGIEESDFDVLLALVRGKR